MLKPLLVFLLCLSSFMSAVVGEGTQPTVAIHDSELTRALASMPFTNGPTGPGTTNKQWWFTDYQYFVMPESVKEALRSDGTAFTVVGDSNIIAGVLLTNDVPRYPILISLASEAIHETEIIALTNYVAKGGFLLAGSSAFTRTTNGTSRGNFAFADAMGVHMVVPSLTNWANNSTNTKTTAHRLVADLPSGPLIWRMPSSAEEISWGISPDHPYRAPHDIWKVRATNGAVVVTTGDQYPFLVIKPYGKGYFIYHAALQPLIGHGGWAPGMHAYLIFRRAIEWAFESANLPVPKLSPWPYQYDAALMMRHDMENYTNLFAPIEASARFEYANGVKGDYYLVTGTVREDATNKNAIIAALRSAVTNYRATICPHNGGLKNPNNPALVRSQYDYWHWGPDEALDVTPTNYASGKLYALTSISNAFKDVEGWLSGTGNGSGLRPWVSPYFNATREDSLDIQAQLGIRIAGDQKLTPFPHWTLSTRTPGKRYAFLSQPVSDWFVGGLVAQSLEPWHPPAVHTSTTMREAVDFYYALGALINVYSHTLSTNHWNGTNWLYGDAGLLPAEYITYSMDTNLHPRLWPANAVGVYQWWLQRSNAQISVAFTTNLSQMIATINVTGATDTNTAVEILVPGTNAACNVQVLTNGIVAGGDSYRINGQVTRVKVGTTVTNAAISYYMLGPASQLYSNGFDSVVAPSLPADWATATNGDGSFWVTESTINDTAPNAAYVQATTNIGTSDLVSPAMTLPIGVAQLAFRNKYDLEAGNNVYYDGGVLEIKIGTGSFTDILAAGGSFVSGGYEGTITNGYGSPLAGRPAWSGDSGGFITTLVNLPAAAMGQTSQFRWRFATDSGGTKGSGWHIDSIALIIRACPGSGGTNTAPVLPSQSDRTVAELTTLTVTNTAADADFPAQVLSYELLTAPAGAVIGTDGVISWTPTEAQGPGTNVFQTLVSDSGLPPLIAINSFMVMVTEANSVPTFPAPTNRTVLELTTLTVTNWATDGDLPTNTLSYTLLAAPSGAGLTNGVITWTPTEVQGPSTNTFTTGVVDDGIPALSATNIFTVVVNESNRPPVLPAQMNRTIAPQTLLSVTNEATDLDLPANTLTYAMLVGPDNAAINTNTGVITWTPTGTQEDTTNVMITVVTDYNPWAVNAQRLSATNSFAVVVLSGPKVLLDTATLVGEGFVPTNSAVDPGETVTVLFGLKNTGGANTTNLVVTLLATNGVVGPTGPQTYGALVAGGDAVAQPFTFTASGVCGGSIIPTLQLQDGPTNSGIVAVSWIMGQIGTVLTQSFDTVTAPALPSGWTSSAAGAQSPWFTTNSLSDTTPNAAVSASSTNVGINELVSPPILLSSGPAQLSFRHRYSFEADFAHATNGYDGGVLEIKIGTNGYTDITDNGGSWITNGYNRQIDTRYESPLAGRWTWSGTNSSYVTTTVALPPAAAGQLVQLRWRCGTDNGGPSGAGWRVDSIGLSGVVCGGNTAPVLPQQTNWTIVELAMLTVTNAATDLESPPQELIYSLLEAPTNAVISTNGVITWMPSEAQGPGSFTFTTMVADTAAPPASATNSFIVLVSEQNSEPALTLPANQAIDELVLWSTNATAIDTDVPPNMLTFEVVSGPGGLTVSSNGLISWTPAEDQGPSTNTVIVRVSDDGSPSLSVTNSFTLTVNEVNGPPLLTVPADQTIDELLLWSANAAASDTDAPPNTLAFELVSGPGGLTVSSNGLISWTPAEDQGPATNAVLVRVSDDGSPSLSVTNSFTLTVNEVNSAPVLTLPANQTIEELVLWSTNATAIDTDVPPNLLTFELVSGPGGLTVSSNGLISWTPTEAQGSSTNVVTVRVFDDGVLSLGATNDFVVTVVELTNAPPPVIQDISISNGVVTLTWSTIAGYSYALERKDSMESTNWTTVAPPASAVGPRTSASEPLGDAPQRFYRIIRQP